MSDWRETELAACQMHDARHTQRLARRLDRRSERPVGSLPTACHGWAETVAASRFLHNPDIGVQEILSGHLRATLERLRTQEVVLLVPDTTFLHDGTPQPTAGMGTGKSKTRDASLLQPTVAFTPERVNFGLVGLQVWPRPDQPVAPQRQRKPLAEKERSRGLEGSQGACAGTQTCPATLVVNMADRAGDIQAGGVDARHREPDSRAACLMRAKGNRRLAPGAAPRY